MIRYTTCPRALLAIALLAFCAALPARADMPTGQPIDGIHCDAMEGSVFHIHQHLTVLDHGKPITIPPDVGRPQLALCFYWIHTHTPDGIIHIESPAFRSFTLGNFFDIWGQPLTPTRVAAIVLKKGQLRAYVDGQPYTGDPRAIGMTLHADIVLEAGPPYVKPTPFTDWQGN